MGTNSSIEWTHHTWNPQQGCTPVHTGCVNCYMYRDKRRYGQDPTVVVRSKPPTFRKVLSPEWRSGQRVFVCSWSDFYHPAADGWRPEAWDLMARRPDLRYIIPTKRPERIVEHLPDWWAGQDNFIHLASVSDQPSARWMVPPLLRVQGLRGLSVEPLVAQLDLVTPGLIGYEWTCPECGDGTTSHLDEFDTSGGARPLRTRTEPWCPSCREPDADGPGRDTLVDLGRRGLDWVIVGGESGPNARAMRAEWADSLVTQARSASVPVFVKQMGAVYGRRVGVDPMKGGGLAIPGHLRFSQFPAGWSEMGA